jgi:hypothetical protein
MWAGFFLSFSDQGHQRTQTRKPAMTHLERLREIKRQKGSRCKEEYLEMRVFVLKINVEGGLTELMMVDCIAFTEFFVSLREDIFPWVKELACIQLVKNSSLEQCFQSWLYNSRRVSSDNG